jgi:hypothetical protein
MTARPKPSIIKPKASHTSKQSQQGVTLPLNRVKRKLPVPTEFNDVNA